MGRDDRPPRAGVNNEDAFLGGPPRRPTGPSPFDPPRDGDGDVEGEVALEVISQMSRSTGGYEVIPPRRTPYLALAIVAGIAVAGLIVYFVFRR